MVLVADDVEVLELVVEDRRAAVVETKRRVRVRVAGEQRLDLLAVVVVDVAVAAGPDEVAELEVGTAARACASAARSSRC